MADDSMDGDVAESLQAAADLEMELSQDMSLVDVTFIGVGAMIETGVQVHSVELGLTVDLDDDLSTER